MAERHATALGMSGARDEAALWAALAAAAGPTEFCRAWLDLQCSRTPGATGGLILLESGPGRFAPAAIWPAGPSSVDALRRAGEAALNGGRPVIEPDPEQPATTCIAYPVASRERVRITPGSRSHGTVCGERISASARNWLAAASVVRTGIACGWAIRSP